MSGFALDGWALLGAMFILVALGAIAGAALGYFTASTDLKREKAKAWDAGSAAALAAVRRIWQPPTTLIAELRNPYGRGLAPEPPHIVIPNPPMHPGWTGARLHPDSRRDWMPPWPADKAYQFFDQDAPTEAAAALELRGDD